MIQFDSARWMQDSGGVWLCLHVTAPAAAKEFCATMQPKLYDADLKIHREKRSLDANAYAWVLMGRLSAKLHIPTAEVYRQYIREIGDNFEIVPIRDDAKDTWVKNWQSRGIGWICDDLGHGKIDGYSNIVCYFGSSTYDTKQMSCLIELVAQDCKAQGIETLPPDKLDAMKLDWRHDEQTHESP